jgi:hypothetical protein
LTILATRGERFEAPVPEDTVLAQLAADYFEHNGWPLYDEDGRRIRAVIGVWDVENPENARYLNAALTVAQAGLHDGDLLIIFPETQTAPAVFSDSGLIPVGRATTGHPKRVRRYSDVSFPAEVRVGKVTNLRVAIALQPPHAHDVALVLERELPGPVVVTVCVSAENFIIRDKPQAQIVVPLKGNSPAAVFALEGERVGPGRVMVDFFQEGRPLGSVDLRPVVVAGEPAAKQAPVTGGTLGMGAPGGPEPDVTLLVHEDSQSPGRLHFTLVSRDPRLRDLPVTFGDLKSVDLKEAAATWTWRKLQTLNRFVYAQDSLTLDDVGHQLYEKALPEPLQALCWTLAERGVRTVLVLSDEHHIPWELIKPWRTDPATGNREEKPFWGESFALTRWLRGPALAGQWAVRQVYATAVVDGDEAEGQGPAADTAAAEIGVLQSLETAGRRVRVLEPQRGEVTKAFLEGGFDLFHLASHGAFGGRTTGDASAVWLNDAPFRAGDVVPRMEEGLRKAAPLVFFNACETGRVGYSLTQLGSWAGEFVRRGCGGFVGTLWNVSDDGALAFARAFYRVLFQGTPVGEAVRKARLEVRDQYPHDSTWLAYACFADPLATVEGAPAGGLVPASRP